MACMKRIVKKKVPCVHNLPGFVEVEIFPKFLVVR